MTDKDLIQELKQLLQEVECFVSIDCKEALAWEVLYPKEAELYYASSDRDPNNPWRQHGRALLARIAQARSKE